MKTATAPVVPVLLTCLTIAATAVHAASPAANAKTYASAIEKINRAHAQRPGDTTEEELAKKLPRNASGALDDLLKAEPTEISKEALFACGEAALDLARLDDFEKIRKRLGEVDKARAAELGDAVARGRFLVRGIGAFEDGYLDDFADLTDAVLDAYGEVFGFKEWSKVPGKKIRIRVHLEKQIKRPPHFAPQLPFHSEIDMPVINAKRFESPTARGQMMFYGLCHELGHLIAMWGDRNNQEDHHAWAHYTGVVIVEHMAKNPKYAKLLDKRRDVRWRALSLEKRKDENQVEPSTENRAAVMSLLIKLHDAVGAKVIGEAMNLMDEKDAGSRINHVRYYGFDDLEKALKVVVKDTKKRAEISKIFR